MWLATLSEARGVSGDEGEVRRLLRQPAAGWAHRLETDPLGNLLCYRHEGRPGPRLLVAAHMDEVGLLIARIEENGLLRFKKVGGIDDRVLPGKAVRIGREGVPGVILSKPIHLTRSDDRRRPFPADELLIDIGAADRREAEALVRVGDYATFDTRFEAWGDVFKGKALDDRAGCALALEVLAAAAAEGWETPLCVAFTAQEEVGLRGARPAAYRAAPHLALVLEVTTCAETPDVEPHRRSTRLGHGPALTLVDAASIPDRELVDTLADLASSLGLPFQWKETTLGGTDAGAIQPALGGVRVATLSLPGRYIHGPAALISRTDWEAARQLAIAFAREVPRRFRHLA